jgi:hypothetical protein
MTAVKLQRERAVAGRRREKQQRRAESKQTVVAPEGQEGVEDADLAGIRPGPQPPQAWQLDE